MFAGDTEDLAPHQRAALALADALMRRGQNDEAREVAQRGIADLESVGSAAKLTLDDARRLLERDPP